MEVEVRFSGRHLTTTIVMPNWDYGWTPLRIYDDADSESIIDVGCNARLPSEGVDHTFRLNLNTKDGIRSCIIELPPSVSIQFLSLNFHERHTFARIITGNVHNRPSVSSPLLRKNTPSDQIFSVDCAYGFLVVRFESPEDTVVFKVHHKEFDPENDMYVTDDQCRPRED
uniref:Galectin n=1 Tax=Panagrellus redivivus TaxID=6233 RepID=A0A7E4UT91_PANRE